MDVARQNIILLFIVVFLALCIGVGIWALRRTKTTGDFFMAGRDLGILVTGFAVFSATMSGFGFVGGPGLVYSWGMSSVWMVVCSSLGFCVSFHLLSKRLRMFAEVRDTVSLPDAIAARYNSEWSRGLSAAAIILGVVGYLGTQILAMATVLCDLFANHPSLPHLSLGWCMFISCAVLVFYCVTGGIIAGVYTDMIQGAVMMVGAILIFHATLEAVPGGMAGAVTTIMNDDPESMGPWGTLGMMGCLSWFFLFALGAAGQPHVITKLMMNKRIGDAKHILPLSIFAYAVSALLWISIGLAMRALVLQGTHAPLASGDAAAPEFLQHYVNPVLAGIVFAGLFAAIMSTADSFLNIGAAAAIHDIPKAIWGRAARHELFWARTSTLILGAVSALFALYVQDLVALLGAFGWGTFAAALVPTVAIGFNWKRATALAANTAMASSLLVNFILKLSGIPIPYGFSGGAIALMVSLLLFFSISFLSKPPRIATDIEALMDL